MMNLAATVSDFHEAVSTRKSRNSLMSLRSTKTSEISSFVKNCNDAENHYLNKELNIWLKSTNFNLRRIDEKRERMYKSLLQLSTAKKKIKNVRQEKKRDKSEHQKWLLSQRQERRKNIWIRQRGLTLKEISEQDEVASLSESNCLKIIHDGVTDADDVNSDSAVKTKLNVMQHGGNSRRKSFCDVVQDAVRAVRDRSETELVKKATPESPTSQHRQMQLDFTRSLKALGVAPPLSPHVSRQPHTEVVMAHAEPEYVGTSAQFLQKPIYNQGIPPNEESTQDKFLIEHEADLPDQDVLEEDNVREHPEILQPLMDTGCEKGSTTKRKKKQKFTNLKIDPTEKLNSISSVQARPGHKYDVAVYKKDSHGNLEKEVVTWDTTVDVCKHFNIASRKKRLERKELLIAAQNQEIMQRHRVNRFLQKLDHEMEIKKKDEINRRRQAEEAKLALERRIEALRKGPPKYGVEESNGLPNYVRSYVKPTKFSPSKPRQVNRKKSSWSVPSLFTLQLARKKGGSSFARTSFSSGDSVLEPSLAEASSSHLVNINIDKYLIDSANASGA